MECVKTTTHSQSDKHNRIWNLWAGSPNRAVWTKSPLVFYKEKKNNTKINVKTIKSSVKIAKNRTAVKNWPFHKQNDFVFDLLRCQRNKYWFNTHKHTHAYTYTYHCCCCANENVMIENVLDSFPTLCLSLIWHLVCVCMCVYFKLSYVSHAIRSSHLHIHAH